jgi:hypothetical protein
VIKIRFSRRHESLPSPLREEALTLTFPFARVIGAAVCSKSHLQQQGWDEVAILTPELKWRVRAYGHDFLADEFEMYV